MKSAEEWALDLIPRNLHGTQLHERSQETIRAAMIEAAEAMREACARYVETNADLVFVGECHRAVALQKARDVWGTKIRALDPAAVVKGADDE